MKYFYLLLFLLISSAGFAQTNGISYQAVILDPSEQQMPGENRFNA